MGHYLLEPANFSDYRDFLKARFDRVREGNKKFSLQACASRAKISKSLLQFIFTKKRHIGLDKIPGLAKSLKLTSDEEYFVCLMVCKSVSRNAEIQSHFEGILNRLRHQYVKVAAAEPVNSRSNDKRLYESHLMMNMQTLIRLPDFQEDIGWIRRALQIPDLDETVIRAVLDELVRSGFVERGEDGRLVANPESLWRPDPFDPSGHSVYRAAAQSVADLLTTKGAFRPSVYMSMSLAMDEKNLLEAEKFMIEVHHKLFALSKASVHPTAVAFIGNFMLTVARLKA